MDEMSTASWRQAGEYVVLWQVLGRCGVLLQMLSFHENTQAEVRVGDVLPNGLNEEWSLTCTWEHSGTHIVQ